MLNLLSSIKGIMSTDLITLGEFDPLSKVEQIFKNNKIHHIPVTESNKLIGIVSKSDFLFFQRGFNSDESKYDSYRLKTHFVHQIMTTGVAKMDVEDKINVALEIFKENIFHAIPVEEHGKLVGIVTTYDVIENLAASKGAVNQYT